MNIGRCIVGLIMLALVNGLGRPILAGEVMIVCAAWLIVLFDLPVWSAFILAPAWVVVIAFGDIAEERRIKKKSSWHDMA